MATSSGKKSAATATGGAASIASMTAFARVQHDIEGGHFAWELRSVNHRYLETNFKLPEKFRQCEPAYRERLRKTLARGKVECTLYYRVSEVQSGFQIDHAVAGQLLAAASELAERHDISGGLSTREILNWPGVLGADEDDLDEIGKLVTDGLEQALQTLVAARRTEGSRMAAVIAEKLDAIEELVTALRARMPEILEEHQQKINDRIAALDIDVDPDRLTQEMVLVAQKTDVAEELDRLTAHVSEVRDILTTSEPCGRRLDFLMQELNREANTLGSKSIALESSNGAISLKVLIEQIREQVQNIE